MQERLTFGSGGLQFLQPTPRSQQISNTTSPNGGSVYSSQVWRNFEEKGAMGEVAGGSSTAKTLSRQTSKLNLTADFPNEVQEEINNGNS